MYETRKQPQLHPADFLRRLLAHVAIACVLLLSSVALVLAPVVHRVVHRFHPDED